MPIEPIRDNDLARRLFPFSGLQFIVELLKQIAYISEGKRHGGLEGADEATSRVESVAQPTLPFSKNDGIQVQKGKARKGKENDMEEEMKREVRELWAGTGSTSSLRNKRRRSDASSLCQ